MESNTHLNTKWDLRYILCQIDLTISDKEMSFNTVVCPKTPHHIIKHHTGCSSRIPNRDQTSHYRKPNGKHDTTNIFLIFPLLDLKVMLHTIIRHDTRGPG